MSPVEPRTTANRRGILATLQGHAATCPDATALSWCEESGEVLERWTYAELLHRAQRSADTLVRLINQGGEAAKDKETLTNKEMMNDADKLRSREANVRAPCCAPRVLLLAPQGLDYIAGFYGALFAGVIPVTLPAPRSRRSVERVRLVAKDCAPVAMLVTQAQQAGLKKAIAQVPALAVLPQVILDGEKSSPGLKPVKAFSATERAKALDYFEGTAFLQYTSGSTSQPKGVMVTHANLAHQCQVIREVMSMGTDTVMIC